MTENIVPLKTFRHAAVEDVVLLLERELELAKQGRTVAIAIVTECDDGDISTCASKCEHFYKIIGGLASLQHRMLADKLAE